MKVNKLFSALVVSSVLIASVADAASIGRSGGSSASRSSSVSRPSQSYSAPKPSPAPSVAPSAPAKPGGIGGTQGSVGVRKSEVTAPVAQKTNPPTQSTATSNSTNSGNTNYSGSGGGYNAPAPSYGGGMGGGGSGLGMGGVFASSLGGSLLGSMIGNSLFGHGSHGGGGTTVINNGTPTGGTVPSTPSMAADPGAIGSISPSGMSPSGVVQSQSKGYTMWNFIGDVITFAILIAVLLGVAFLFYKGYKMVRNYINRERGVGTSQPFPPTARFWEIQRAFASADVAFLKTLLGPDVVDELTTGLEASAINLSGVSHEVVLNTPTEFSIHYTFTDAGETINQVWHFDKIGNDWLLNGIENV